MSRIDLMDANEANIFIDSPGDLLCKFIADNLKAESHWAELFADRIDPYERMDYSIRELPALRVYSKSYNKDFESWFIEGDVVMDIILPPELRRDNMQRIEDQISGALMQQFRRPNFFSAIETSIAGLNELGKRFYVDKTLGFEINEELAVPLVQVTCNYRIDLRIWDEYLEKTERTKDSPFEEVLAQLKRISSVIQGLEDDNETVNVKLDVEQKV